MDKILVWVLAALLLCAVLALLLLVIRVLLPFKRLRRLAARLDTLEPEELRSEVGQIGGAPGEAACALLASSAPSESSAGTGSAAAEERYKMAVVDEICASLLPQALKNKFAGMTFSLAGGVQSGTRLNCAFYDHFFLDENTLCLAVGQVAGNGTAEAMFAVVAQTTIRSQLRMGRSLVEAMSDVNAQLYDLGGRNSVNALVCVLNTVNGRFSFVNAGGSLPLLMRSEERYEWLNTPVYAPLGANESVTYRSEVLRLNQGDRLFLYTADLGEMKNRDGERFRDREFQSVLNRSRSQGRGTDELLRFVQDEAAAFCESGDDVLSSAAIALEYVKGNRDFIFTLVRPVPDDAPLVTEFMRKALAENNIAPKDCARQILLADELFALCCRSCTAHTDVKVECAIKPDENVLHLRMFAPMGGSDPLSNPNNPSGGNAANYIRTHTKRAAFEAGIERDMLEIISELSRA